MNKLFPFKKGDSVRVCGQEKGVTSSDRAWIKKG